MATFFARLREVLRSTSFRLGLIQVVAFAVAVSALTAVVYSSTHSWLTHQLDEDIRDDIAALADEANTQGVAAVTEHIRRMLADPERGDTFYLLVDRDGRRLAGNAPTVPRQTGWVDMQLSTRVSHRGRPKDREHVLRGRAQHVADGALLYVGRDIYPAGQEAEIIVRSFAICLAATITIALVLSLVTSLGVLRRVEAISRASREIMAGDLSRRLPRGRRRDEFDGLAVQLNAMLERIEALMEDVRQVTNDIAHDLRTPLAHLRHGLEDARRRACSVQDYERAVDAAVEETDRILDTFTALLRIAQIEACTRRAGFSEVDLSGLLAGLAETYAVVAEDRGQALSSTIGPDVRAVGDNDVGSGEIISHARW